MSKSYLNVTRQGAQIPIAKRETTDFTFILNLTSLLQSQSRNPSRPYFTQIKISKKLLIHYIEFYASSEKSITLSKIFTCQ